MLTRVKINNYRSLRDVAVPLKPFTILVGANNTGKSAFLSAIQLIGGDPNRNPNAPKFTETDVWRLDKNNPPIIAATPSNGGELLVRRAPTTKAFWEVVGDTSGVLPINYFNSSILNPAMVSPGVTEKQGVPQIDDKVTNLPAYLDALLRRDRDRFFAVLDTLKKMIPGLYDINILTPTAEHRRIDITWEDGMTMEAQYASYGVRLMIFFAALANHPNPPKTILIEEPETGVHPKRLANIIKLLISLSEGKLADNPTQVIITTHSPYLLDCIDPELQQVLVFQRKKNGESDVQPVDTEKLKYFLEDFSIGEVWLNREEKDLVEKGI